LLAVSTQQQVVRTVVQDETMLMLITGCTAPWKASYRYSTARDSTIKWEKQKTKIRISRPREMRPDCPRRTKLRVPPLIAWQFLAPSIIMN